jgi:hypothetical protein
MLKVEEIEGQNAVFVISDDKNTENMALDEAVNLAAPHLHESFTNTKVDDEGVLKWRVEASEYGSLLEVLDVLEGVDPEEVEEADTFVEGLREAAA